jgi:tetratricopeptide (TPR) repeat protein
MKKYLFLLFLSFLCLSSFAQDSVNYTSKMEEFVKNKDYDNAFRMLSLAQEDDYYDMESLYRLACKIYYNQKDYDKAEKMCKKLIGEDESTFEVNMIYLSILSKDKKDDKVGRLVKEMGDEYVDKNILNELTYFDDKDIKNVINSINRYIEKNKLDRYSKEVNQKADNEKKDEEEDEDNQEGDVKPKGQVTQINKTNKNLRSYKILLSILNFHIGNYMESYNNSVEFIDGDNQPVIYYILGVLKQQRKEYNSSIAFLNLAINEGFDSYDAYLNRALSKGYEKSYKSANYDLDTCIMIKNDYYPYYLKAINENYLLDYASAIEDLNTAIEKNDTSANSYNYRGIVYANLKKYSFAISDFKNAISLDYNTQFAHNNLGIAYEKNGELEKAIEEYKTSIKVEPDFFDAYYNLGRVYTDTKQVSYAISYLKRAMKLDSNVPDVYYLLGVNYIAKNNREKACNYLQQALNLGHTLAQEKINDYCVNDDKKEVKKQENPQQNTDNQEDENNNEDNPQEDNQE